MGCKVGRCCSFLQQQVLLCSWHAVHLCAEAVLQGCGCTAAADLRSRRAEHCTTCVLGEVGWAGGVSTDAELRARKCRFHGGAGALARSPVLSCPTAPPCATSPGVVR